MRLRYKIIAAIVATAMISAETCQAADPNHPVQDPAPRPDPKFRIETHIDEDASPYKVFITITGGAGEYPRTIPNLKGDWSHEIVYKHDVRLNVTVTVKAAKNSNTGYCRITDGRKESIDWTGGGADAECNLTTHQ